MIIIIIIIRIIIRIIRIIIVIFLYSTFIIKLKTNSTNFSDIILYYIYNNVIIIISTTIHTKTNKNFGCCILIRADFHSYCH